jgi:hypothetical protein
MRAVAFAAVAAMALDTGHFLQRLEADVAELEAPAGKMKTEGVWCKVISCLILAGWLAPCFGVPALGNLLGAVGSIGAICYVFVGPVYGEYSAGVDVGFWCVFCLVIAVLDLIRLCCVCCCVGGIVAYAVMNPAVVQMAAAMQDLTPEQRAYFSSPEFKQKCEQLFIAAGGTPGGTLHTRELRKATLSAVSPADAAKLQQDPLFKLAFDQNKDEQLDFASFQQVMMYIMVRGNAAGVARVPERARTYERESHTTIQEVE